MIRLCSYHKFVMESVRDQMTPKSEEDIQLAVKAAAQNMLFAANESGTGKSRVDFFDPRYKKYLEEYILVDGLFDIDTCFILYMDSVYKMESVPGGEFYTMLTMIPENVDELIAKLKEMLKKLE